MCGWGWLPPLAANNVAEEGGSEAGGRGILASAADSVTTAAAGRHETEGRNEAPTAAEGSTGAAEGSTEASTGKKKPSAPAKAAARAAPKAAARAAAAAV